MLRPRRRLLTGGCAAARVEQGSHPHPHSADDTLWYSISHNGFDDDPIYCLYVFLFSLSCA